ncbi:NADPH:quinone oxidoreductase family protein [Haloterrigena salinisoli]|uniref:quinone oxidoreductase family protein n=1 Tax=Haloterrigena salinisoli TaxID=3132747 RepID=UPI0030D596BC
MDAIHVPEYGGPEVLELVDVEIPDPDDGEVRIDVRAAGVNFADIEKRRGNYPDGPTPPYRPGMEVAGVVEATGSGTDLAAGDRVAALTSSGGYAEYTVVSTDTIVPYPERLSFASGTALPVQWLTAHNVLFEWGGLRSGERVLITAGAGGVGTAAVQLAATAGATVIAAASSEEKRDLVRDLGANRAVEYSAIDDISVDLALDGVGGRTFTDAVKALVPGGRIVTYGMASGRVPTVATPRLFFQNKSVVGYHLEEALERAPERVLSAIPELVDSVSDNSTEVVVGDTIPLPRASEAHRRLQQRESHGKLVLVP